MSIPEIWFTSDLHLGHERIIDFRQSPKTGQPFASLDDHDEWIIEQWNSQVGNDDVVWVLGDFVMGHKIDTLPKYVLQLKGQIHLVPGNHDGMFEGEKVERRLRWMERYAEFGIVVHQPRLTTSIDGKWVVMSHFPYDFDERHGARFAPFHPHDAGLPLLHGHVHDLWQTKERQINVGIDVWGRLIGIKEMSDLIEEVKG